jgi:hypothetical protein
MEHMFRASTPLSSLNYHQRRVKTARSPALNPSPSRLDASLKSGLAGLEAACNAGTEHSRPRRTG